MLIPLRTDIASTSYNHIMMANSSSFACNDEDHVVLLQNVELKLQHVNENFECFKEDFENLAFIGNNIKKIGPSEPELIWYLATKYNIGPRDMCSLALKKLFRGR